MRMFFLIGLCPFLLSCDSKNNAIYSKTIVLRNGWSYHKPITFLVSFEEMNKTPYLDFYLLIRKDVSYPFENLFLITTFKNAKTVFYQDTLEYLMSHKDGRLLGSGFGSNKKSKLVLKEKYLVSSKGPFELEIRHAMRHINDQNPLNDLLGITSLELQINKVLEQ